MEDNKIIDDGNYDEEKHIFFIGAKPNISFEELYKDSKNKKEKDESNNIFISIGNYIYLFKDPHTINFTFPKGEKCEIFLANVTQLLKINEIIGIDYKITISNDGIKYFYCDDIYKSYASKYIKYVISDIDEEDYKYSKKYIKVNGALTLKDLSLNYKEYLENANLIDNEKEYFLNTDKRKILFEFINKKLLDNKILALCGLEGIGKTASILAYLKYYHLKYFYFNVKAIEKKLIKNEISSIKRILLKELYHCIEFKNAEYYYNLIDKILVQNHSAMDILKELFKNIKNLIEIIVIDQYKTQYDKQYAILDNIINSEYYNKMLIVSSMNEDDLRNSIIKSIKHILNLSEEKPKLDYYYIIELVKVSEEDKNVLNDEQKKLLNDFGNLYAYYYEIINIINNNVNYDLETLFKNKIRTEMNNKLKEFFYDMQNNELLETFSFLIKNDNKEILLNECYNYINKIPLRYYLLKYKEENIIHFSDLNKDTKISFNSGYNFITEYFLKYFHTILVDINKNKAKMSKSNEKNQKSMDLENFFWYYLWGYRNKIKLNNTNIVDHFSLNSIFDMKEEYISPLKRKIDLLAENESLLILQDDQNAKIFDIGILEKKKGYFNFYFIQVTSKKKSDERITLTGINDYINYVNGFFVFKFKTKIKNNYFCYIFDFLSPDNASISFCEKNYIDYFLFNAETLSLNENNLDLKPLKYYLPVFKYSEYFSKFQRMVDIQKLKFNQNEKQLDEKLKETKNFLKKKRALMEKKHLEISEVEKLTIYESKFKKDKITAPTNYERKEFIINNYLLSTEYKNKKIYGVSFMKKNNNELQFNANEMKNLFEFCHKKEDNDTIFQIDKLDIVNIEGFIPEFGCYIIFNSRNNKKYYFDFETFIFYDLENKCKDSFKGKIMIEKGDFYSIIFLNKNISIS